MKSRINFYHKGMRPRRDPVPLKSVLATWCMVTLLVLIVWGGYAYNEFNQQQLINDKQATLQVLGNQLSKTKKVLEEKQNKVLLIKELKTIEQEIAHKQQVFSYLTKASELTSTDYAQVMKDLAQFHQPSVWLTEFSLQGAKVTIKGQTLHSDQLPIWLSSLKQSRYFSGKAFSVLEFTNTAGLNEFMVASESADKEQP